MKSLAVCFSKETVNNCIQFLLNLYQTKQCMKKILLALTISLCFFSESKAQYHPMLSDTTQWCLAWNITPLRLFGDDQFKAVGDTLIDTLLYKAVYGNNTGYYGAFREDTMAQQLYFIKSGDTVEHLLYDFSLVQGNTINVTLYNNSSSNMYSGTYTVDSVGTITIDGGTRKYMELNNPMNVNVGMSGKPLNLIWIESVGEIHNPFYTYAYDDFGYSGMNSACGNDHESAVLRQSMNSVTNYFDVCTQMNVNGDMGSDSCTIGYWGSVKAVNNRSNIGLFPNPSNGNDLTIDVNNYILRTTVTISIADETGRLVYSENKMPVGNAVKLNCLNLIKGIYFISLNEGAANIAKSKLVVVK
jgi:hypothetical protein